MIATSADAAAGTDLRHPDEWPVYREEAVQRATDLLRGGRSFDYDHGEELAGLEAAFAARVGRRHCLALCSGTAALLAAFHALGIGPGDEVLVPDYTFFSAATPLLTLGAVPVLCDPDEPTGNVGPAAFEARVTPRTVAIAVTHLWGCPGDLDGLRRLADRHGLALVEDCSHAHGATYRGRPVGSVGDVAVFSVGGRKLVSGGMGGVLLTDDEQLYARACLLANFRHRTDLTVDLERYEPFLLTGLGGNFRMSPVAAVLAGDHLARLDDLVRVRQDNVGRLLRGLAELPGLAPPPVGPDRTTGAWYDAVVEYRGDAAESGDAAVPPDRLAAEDRMARVSPAGHGPRDELVAALRRDGLLVRAPSTRPLHHYPIFRGAIADWSPLLAWATRAAAARNDRPFPAADGFFRRWIRLPVGHLWQESSPLVPRYVEAFARRLAPA